MTDSTPSHLTDAQITAVNALREALPNKGIAAVRNVLAGLPGYGDDLDLIVVDDGAIDGDIKIDSTGLITVTWDPWDVLNDALALENGTIAPAGENEDGDMTYVVVKSEDHS